MGALEEAIEQAVRKIAGKMQLKQVLTGTASEVTETTCTVIREDAPTLHDVRLNAIDDDLQSQFTVYPKDGSHVVVAILEGVKTEAILLRCSEVEKAKIKIGTQTLTMTADGFVFNGGDLGGMVKINELKTQLAKATKRIDDVIAALQNGVPAAGAADGGAGYKTSVVAYLTAIVDKESFSNIEDTKIKH